VIFERTLIKEDGQEITIQYCKHNEINESSVLGGVTADKHSTQLGAESPFRHHDFNLKTTGLFVDRFFHAWSWKDLASKYEVSVKVAQTLYARAEERLQKVVTSMDRREFVASRLNQSKEFSKGERYFLLNQLFDLTPADIAELEGLAQGRGSASRVSELIIRVKDRLKTGEIQLIKTTDEEQRQAEIRLTEYRHKRRESRNYKRKKPPEGSRAQALALIKEKREERETFSSIADLLNARKHPTPSGRGTWTKTMAHGLLRRSKRRERHTRKGTKKRSQ
jgi:hypothetical protein